MLPFIGPNPGVPLYPPMQLAGTPLILNQGSGYAAEAVALFARFTTPPSDARKVPINGFISALKLAGVWDRLDALYVMAAADAQAAQRNWKADAFNLTPQNTPTFTADQGYAGNGTTSYLDTGFNPSTAPSPKFTLNDAHLSGWCRTARAADTTVFMGATAAGASSVLQLRNSDFFIANMSSLSGKALANTDTTGDFMGVRTGAAALTVYKNGGSASGGAQASVSVPTTNLYIGAANATGTPGSFTTDQAAVVSIGASLSAAQVLAFYNAKLAYLQAVGAA